MAAVNRGSALKIKQTNQDGPSKVKMMESSSIKRKFESSSKQPIDPKKKPATIVKKTEVKIETKSGTSKTMATKTTRVREKKVYSLAGQKYDPPEEREPLRIFYESLFKQIPKSEMAEFWMMEHGLLPPERAKKAFEKKQRKQKELRSGTPIKSSNSKPPAKPAESSKRQPQPQQASKNGDTKAKRKVIYDSGEDDDDFILSPKRRKG